MRRNFEENTPITLSPREKIVIVVTTMYPEKGDPIYCHVFLKISLCQLLACKQQIVSLAKKLCITVFPRIDMVHHRYITGTSQIRNLMSSKHIIALFPIIAAWVNMPLSVQSTDGIYMSTLSTRRCECTRVGSKNNECHK